MGASIKELEKTFLECKECDEPLPILESYACVDCTEVFHRKCLLKHIKLPMEGVSLTKLPLKEAYKFIDS
jgi:hypothetical protein